MKYQVRQKQVEAVQWDGSNQEEISTFLKDCQDIKLRVSETELRIYSLDSVSIIDVGDYVVREKIGSFYIYRKENFERDYELVK